jgi:tetratricopeptide (TPR) repeat protein
MYVYRAYASFVLEDYEACVKDYQKANGIQKLSSLSLYNMQLAQGLKFLHSSEFENAISYFTKAALKQTSARDPFLLRGISVVRFVLQNQLQPQIRIKTLKDGKRDLNRSIANSSGKDSQVLLLRSLVNFGLNYFFDAIVDIEHAIESSDEA